MPSVAITGNLGSGKTTVLNELATLMGSKGFDVSSYSADEQNRKLLQEDEQVRNSLVDSFGEECLNSEGRPDRLKLIAILNARPDAKAILEGILHPRLESQWKPLAQEAKGSSDRYFLAEIPLLFEKGLEESFDRTLVVACSEQQRHRRLKADRSMAPEEIDRWISLQMPQEEKIARANHLLWNDGSPSSRNRQLLQFLRYL